MRPLPPPDNALFLVAWRERTRPATVLAAAVVTVAVTALILVGSFAVETGSAGHALRLLSVFQGFVVFILGSYQVGRVAARERETGTMAFHRASPTSRLDQVLGIVIGAPALEWCIFAATLPVSLVLLPMSKVGPAAFFGLYASMVLTALFFHSLAAAVALARAGVQKTIKGNAMGVVPAIVLLIAGAVAIWMHASTLYHASSIPAYYRFFREAGSLRGGGPAGLRPVLFSVFGVRVPSICLQIIVQVPFALLALVASIRLITNPDRPVLSKKQLLVGAGHALLLSTASVATYLTAEGSRRWSGPDPAWAMGCFIFVVVLVGVLGALESTPRQLLHLKALRRARKLGREGLAPMEDAAPGWTWLAIYCLLAGAAYAVVARLILNTTDTSSTFQLVAGAVAALSWCVWFGCALEYFRLGPHRKSGSLFAVAIALLWFFIPMSGVVLGWAGAGEKVDMLYSISPFIGLPALTRAVVKGGNADFLGAALGVNLALVVATAALAARARRGLVAA